MVMGRGTARAAISLLVVALAAVPTARAEGVLGSGGVGAMGDSLTDGSVAGGERWPEYMQSARGIDMGGPGEPYNVAVSAAAAILLADLPQTNNMVELVRNGDVAVPILWIGGTEMLFTATAGLLSSPWDGPLFDQFRDLLVKEIMRAVDKVMAEGPADFIVVSIPDLAATPFADDDMEWTDEEKANVSSNVDDLNAALVQEVAARGITWVDFTGAFRQFIAQGIVIGGFPLDAGNGLGDQTYFFRDSVHPSIAGNVLMVGMFTQALNKRFGTSFAPFTDLEVLTLAGLEDHYVQETLLATNDLADWVTTFGDTVQALFSDGFEGGDTTGWSGSVSTAR